jgi:hypothetical protein
MGLQAVVHRHDCSVDILLLVDKTVLQATCKVKYTRKAARYRMIQQQREGLSPDFNGVGSARFSIRAQGHVNQSQLLRRIQAKGSCSCCQGLHENHCPRWNPQKGVHRPGQPRAVDGILRVRQ